MSVLRPHRASRISLLAECLEHRRVRNQTRETLEHLALVIRSEQDMAETPEQAERLAFIGDSVEVLRRNA